MVNIIHLMLKKNETSNIEDADKYAVYTGLVTECNNYYRVDYNEELISLRKEKLKKLNNL
jgi:hypothetical protein